MRFQKMIEKWLKNDLFQSSKNEKMTLKKLLIFLEEMKLFNPKLQKLLFFLGEPLRDFHHCFFRCLHFTIDFYYCFWTFSLLIVLVHVTVSSGVFISPLLLLLFFKCFHFTNFLYRDCFCQVLRFCAVVLRVLQIWESFFHSQLFLPYTLSQHLAQPVLIKASPRLVVSPWKLQGHLLKFETQTRLICLFSKR